MILGTWSSLPVRRRPYGTWPWQEDFASSSYNLPVITGRSDGLFVAVHPFRGERGSTQQARHEVLRAANCSSRSAEAQLSHCCVTRRGDLRATAQGSSAWSSVLRKSAFNELADVKLMPAWARVARQHDADARTGAFLGSVVGVPMHSSRSSPGDLHPRPRILLILSLAVERTASRFVRSRSDLLLGSELPTQRSRIMDVWFDPCVA